MKVIPFVLLALLAPATSANTLHALSWDPCDAHVREGVGTELRQRLQCARLRVPVDHREASPTRYIDLPVYRILASRPGSTRETLLFLSGSPAQDPLTTLVAFAHTLTTSADDRRQLSEHFDIVGIAPRGAGAITPDCVRTDPGVARRALFAPSDDGAWGAWITDSRRFVASCGEPSRYIGTASYVEDIEAFRQTLGDSPWHIYAHGYGTWVATWYDAQYPSHAGRLLLDETIPFDQPQWMAQRGGGNIYPDRMLRSETIPGAQLGDLGLPQGITASQITTAMKQWPLALRRAWSGALGRPEDLAAALAVADLWRTTPLDNLHERIAMHRFHSTHVEVDAALRLRAYGLLDTLEGHAMTTRYSVDGASLATTCNDASWTFTPDDLRETERFDRSLFALPDVGRLVMGLPCHAWPYAPSIRPPMETMATRPPFLMVHDGTDIAHPWSALAGIVHTLPSAHLLVDARRESGPLLAQPTRQCSTLIATRYLLSGDVPAETTLHCSKHR